MLILREGDTFVRPCALLLGGFDGLHAGHRTLLAAARETHLAVGATTMVGLKGGVLFTREEREHIFRKNGFDFLAEIDFDDAVRATPAEDFLKNLLARIHASVLICGEDHRFGKGALGTPALLKRLAPCPVEVLPLAEAGGEKVAVSGIKRLLLEGEMERVNSLLGGDYFVQGVVEHGRQVGRQYGFPTLNLSIPGEKLMPKEGVYGGYAETEKGRFSAIVNIGARPTFDVSEKKLEAHLLGFSGDLYDSTVRIGITRFLRPITRFSSVEELKRQLEADKKQVERQAKGESQ